MREADRRFVIFFRRRSPGFGFRYTIKELSVMRSRRSAADRPERRASGDGEDCCSANAVAPKLTVPRIRRASRFVVASKRTLTWDGSHARNDKRGWRPQGVAAVRPAATPRQA
jgi:hypothetical protein